MSESLNFNSIYWIIGIIIALFVSNVVCCCGLKITEGGGNYRMEDSDRVKSWPKELKIKYCLTISGILLDSLSLSTLSFDIPTHQDNRIPLSNVASALNLLTLQFSQEFYRYAYWIAIMIAIPGYLFVCLLQFKQHQLEGSVLMDDSQCLRYRQLVKDPTSYEGKRARNIVMGIELFYSTMSFPMIRMLLSVFLCTKEDNQLAYDRSITCGSDEHLVMVGFGTLAFLMYISYSIIIQLTCSVIRSGNAFMFGSVIHYNGIPFGEGLAPVGMMIDWKAHYIGIKIVAIILSMFIGDNYPLLTLCIFFVATLFLLVVTWMRFPHNVQSVNAFMIVAYFSSFMSVFVAFLAYLPNIKNSWIPFICWLVATIMMIVASMNKMVNRVSLDEYHLNMKDGNHVNHFLVTFITLPVCLMCFLPDACLDHYRIVKHGTKQWAYPRMVAIYENLYTLLPCECTKKLCPSPDYYDMEKHEYRDEILAKNQSYVTLLHEDEAE